MIRNSSVAQDKKYNTCKPEATCFQNVKGVFVRPSFAILGVFPLDIRLLAGPSRFETILTIAPIVLIKISEVI